MEGNEWENLFAHGGEVVVEVPAVCPFHRFVPAFILLLAPIRARFHDSLLGERLVAASPPKLQGVVVVPLTLPDEPKQVKIHQTHLPIPFPPRLEVRMPNLTA